MGIKSGSLSEAHQKVVTGLSGLLADCFTAYVKALNFHWNVSGPRFHMLHALFQEQYEDLQGAIDEVAERIRMIGARPPSSMSEFLKLSGIEEGNGQQGEDEMLAEMVSTHDHLIDRCNDIIAAGEAANDPGTVDLVTLRLQAHEKAVWMLSSHLKK